MSPEVMLQRALAIRTRLQKLRSALPADPADVLRDERLEAYLSFNLLLALQDSIDLAARLVAARGLAVPSSQRQVYEALGAAGIISRETAEAMARAASLRSRIAHSYGSLDVERMVREMPKGIEDVERFVEEILRACSP